MSYILTDVQGLTLTLDEQDYLAHPAVAGVILFTRNYENPAQLRALTAQLYAINPLFIIAVDQEGGRLHRFASEFSVQPAAASYGHRYEQNPQEARHQLQQNTKILTQELFDVGVNCNLLPVLDLNEGRSEIIGARSLHKDPTVVSELASVWIEALHQDGFPAVGKHFPGHGGVVADSHLALPVDTRCREEIETHDLVPFAQMAPQLDAIMTAHVIYSEFDALPATLSPFWLQTVLRARLQFQGVIMSDCLSMAALNAYGDHRDRAASALRAGCDLLIACNHPQGFLQLLDHHRVLHFTQDEPARARVQQFQHRCSQRRTTSVITGSTLCSTT